MVLTHVKKLKWSLGDVNPLKLNDYEKINYTSDDADAHEYGIMGR